MPTYLDLYRNYFGGKDVITQNDLSMSPEEMESFRRVAEIANNKQTNQKGSITRNDYLLNPDDPNSVNPALRSANLSIGQTGTDPRFNPKSDSRSYIRREGNNWRVRDWYDWNSNNRIKPNGERESNVDAALRLIGSSIQNRDVNDLKQALNPISRQIMGDNHGFQTDITIPLSPDQVKRLGSNELTYGGQGYTYEPYQFAKGETVEQAVQKAFQSNQYKPKGDNLKNYVAKVQQRNKQRGSGDTSYYIPQAVSQLPSARVPQKQNNLISALDLISKHIGNFTGF